MPKRCADYIDYRGTADTGVHGLCRNDKMILANIYELWNSAWPAGLIMLSLGTSFAIVLLIASIKLKV